MNRTNRLPPLEMSASMSQKLLLQGGHNRSQSQHMESEANIKQVDAVSRPIGATENVEKSPTRPKLAHKQKEAKASPKMKASPSNKGSQKILEGATEPDKAEEPVIEAKAADAEPEEK